MSLVDFKINVGDDGAVNGMGLVKAPDKLTGDAQENKMIFDELVREVVSVCINRSIDLLMSEAGAGEIGAKDPIGEETKTVQEVLSALKDYVDELKAEKIAALMLDEESEGTVQDVIKEIAKKLAAKITTNQLENRAVTGEKIGLGAVTTEKIANEAVTNEKIAPHAVGTNNLDDWAVEGEKIAPGAVGEGQLADEAVTTGKIASGAVGEKQIADGAVGEKQIANGAVTPDKLSFDEKELLYFAFATADHAGIAVHTDVGAQKAPLKQLHVMRSQSGSAYPSVTIRRVGKNLFDPGAPFADGYFDFSSTSTGNIKSNGKMAYSQNYTPVIGGKDYVIAGNLVSESLPIIVAFYTAQKTFKKAIASASGANSYHFKTPADCAFIRYSVAKSRVGLFTADNVLARLEMGTTSPAYEPYRAVDYVIALKDHSGQNASADYCFLNVTDGTGITFSGSAVNFFSPKITTQLGDNYFFVVEGTGENDSPAKVASLDAVLRLDPTLVYEKLKTAVVAVGSI